MSNRRSNFQNENPNPANYFLEWKSDHQKFAYYDKVKEENIFVPLPFKFLVLDIFHCVKGWNKASESGIYSNEVKYLGSEQMTVKTFANNQTIAKGLWNDIKNEVDAANGKYHSSIYVMTEKGDILNIALRGAAVGSWFEFTKKTKNRLPDEWVTAVGFGEGKNGGVNYTYPTFEFTSVASNEDADLADMAFNTLEAYISKYSEATEEDKAPAVEMEIADNETLATGERVNDPDDLPF